MDRESSSSSEKKPEFDMKKPHISGGLHVDKKSSSSSGKKKVLSANFQVKKIDDPTYRIKKRSSSSSK